MVQLKRRLDEEHAKAAPTVDQKLDAILNRLERMEKRLGELEKARGGASRFPGPPRP